MRLYTRAGTVREKANSQNDVIMTRSNMYLTVVHVLPSEYFNARRKAERFPLVLVIWCAEFGKFDAGIALSLSLMCH